MSMLEVNNLKKVYVTHFGSNKVKALDNVTFNVDEGEFVAVMGESGSGKTTLLNILASLDKPTSGEVRLEGKNIAMLSESEISAFRRQNLGFVFQDFNLLPTLTGYENIALALTIQGFDPAYINNEINVIADKMKISSFLNKYPAQMSGGERQRIACARAIITHPSLILADEPTGALDSKNSRLLLEIMEQVNEEYQTTIMMVTHDPFSASYAKRILFIKDGKIFNELIRGSDDRKEFFQRIIDVTTLLGGDNVVY